MPHEVGTKPINDEGSKDTYACCKAIHIDDLALDIIYFLIDRIYFILQRIKPLC